MSPVRPNEVIIVDRDPDAGELLSRYLRGRGWQAEVVRDPRQIVRRWAHATRPPMVVLEMPDEDPDAFELLGALSAHAIESHVIVCTREHHDLRALGVDRVLPARAPFKAIDAALRELRDGCVVPDAAE